jgi:hypothetical protein
MILLPTPCVFPSLIVFMLDIYYNVQWFDVIISHGTPDT